MSVERVDTLVIGGGQAGLAMSEHLSNCGVPHIVVERNRIAESWRTRRWDSLVANGPAWHDRFPGMEFPDIDPDGFASKNMIVTYFEAYAEQISAPIRCGLDVQAVYKKDDESGFIVETSVGVVEAVNVIVATGPFQKPIIPSVVPTDTAIMQIHSNAYKNPDQLPGGAVLVIGAGSSGVQIAEEIMHSGKRVFLSVGPHSRPPRRYRGRDFCWWLGTLGMWDAEACDPSMEHVTIAVSGAHGGYTVDFRQLADDGMILLGRAESFNDGKLDFAPDLAKNIIKGDADYLATLDAADAYIVREGLDWPEEPDAREIAPDPECMTNPVLALNLVEAGITSIIWATGYSQDFEWLKVDTFDEKGRPVHRRGVSKVPGLYFLGLPWLSRRASPFIWGVWHDAKYLSECIAKGVR